MELDNFFRLLSFRLYDIRLIIRDTLFLDIPYGPLRPEFPDRLHWEGIDDHLSELASVGFVELEPVGIRFAHEGCWWPCVDVQC